MNPTWSWAPEFLGNVVTLACLAGSFGYFAHVIFMRNKAGRRDRLVWGLIGVFNAVMILSAVNLSMMLGVLPDHDWIRWPLRALAVVFCLNGAVAARNAEPMVYLSDMALLNQRVLNKRRLLDKYEHDLARYKALYGDLPDA